MQKQTCSRAGPSHISRTSSDNILTRYTTCLSCCTIMFHGAGYVYVFSQRRTLTRARFARVGPLRTIPTCKKRPLDLRTHSGSKKRPLDLRTQNGCGHHLNKFGLRWTKVYDHGMISATHIGINNSPA